MDDKDKTTEGTSEGTSEGNGDGDGNNSHESNNDVRSYTQEQLNEMFAARAKQAKRSVLSDLGVDDIETLKHIIESHNTTEEEKRKAEEAEKSEIQKLQEQLAQKDSEAKQWQSQWQTSAIESDMWRQALSLDVPQPNIKALIKLADKSEIKIENGTISGSKEAVEKTLTENPFLKLVEPTEETENEKPKGPGTPAHNRFKMPVPSTPPVERKRMKL